MTSTDHGERLKALDPGHSFIVQAPAGSGKTELLTQRYLRLLSMVDRPEKVLAITFTRKATQEMRERILQRLRQAGPGMAAPASEHERIAVAFAGAVREKDLRLGWGLLRNPARLQIQTIDGLCARIAGMLPAPGEGVSGLRIIEDATPLYEKAARRLIEDIGSSDAPDFAHGALARLLVHLQGNAGELQKLLAVMLSRRDQWLNLLQKDDENAPEALAKRQQVELDCVIDVLGCEQLNTLMEHLLPLTAGAMDAEKANCLADAIDASSQAPGDTHLQTVAVHLVLQSVATQAGTPFAASSVNSKVFAGGGGVDRDQHVKAIKVVVEDWREKGLASTVFTRFVEHPPMGLMPDQEAILVDCITLLQIADAELRLLFAEENKADFQYLAEMAIQALGPEERPGDVLLWEDHRLSHILMDEFQDTSHIQFKLLKRLTSGWQADDGRSLFLVGDPMQSIYRFRKADVSLFKQVFARQALGNTALQTLQLRSNFRSRQEIISWVNTRFSEVFEQELHVSPGAVDYVEVDAERDPGGRVVAHTWSVELGDTHEAALVADLIATEQERQEGIRIAVLGRGRKHLAAIAQELKDRGINYEAIQVEGLSGRPVILDLLTILRAILHPLDRIAWLALLRAPWAGLEPRDMHAFAGNDGREDMLALMLQADRLEGLDMGLMERIKAVAGVMHDVVNARDRLPLHRLVEAAWIRLKGPYSVGSQPELDNAQGFFRLLAEVEADSPEDVHRSLLQRLENFYSASMESKVQLMTIHKAKGLEFDVVILPGLHKGGGGGGPDFLRIEEFQFDDGSDGVLMAPLKGRDDDGPGLYGYLSKLNREQETLEAQRVLYVAATRARESLHVFGAWKMMGSGKNKTPSCSDGTYMKMLWPVFAQVIDPDVDNAIKSNGSAEPPVLPFLRLESPPELAIKPREPEMTPYQGELRIPDRDALALGDAAHLWLELMHDHGTGGADGDGDWDDTWLHGHRQALKASLVNAGAREQNIATMTDHLENILSAIMNGAVGKKIVSPRGKQASWAELPFYTRDGVRLKKNIIDRIYQTDDGSYVIIDYKTGHVCAKTRQNWQEQLGWYRTIVEGYTGGEVSGLDVFQLENGTIIGQENIKS